MSEYIKRDDVIELLEQVINAEEFFDTDNAKAQSDLALWFEERISELPKADVVEIVRCKGCKVAESVNCPMWRAHFGYTDTDFCSMGVPKEQEHE